MQKILVLRGGALGDFIVTLPALALLRERWPKARVEFAGNAVAAQLALPRGLINAAHSQHEARWAALFADSSLPAEFDRWLSGFDLVINYWPDPDRALGRHFPRHPGQRFLSGAALPTRTPAAAHYCEPLRALGIETREYFFPLVPLGPLALRESRGVAPPTRRVARPGTTDTIAIHPGSGSPRKNWPAENWRRLIARLPAPVSMILGEAEAGHFDSGAAPSQSGGQPRCTLINRPLEELVDHLAQSRLFLGHDSGISHLAAACGTPCVLLFGPTDPAMWAPPAAHVRVLRCAADPASLSIDAVQRAVEEALADRR